MIKIISSKDTIPIRHKVLRAGKPIESCFFDGDTLETTIHFGLFIANELKGVASVFENDHKKFSENKQFQLRGMAILDSNQSSGLGTTLLKAVEEHVSHQNGKLLWCNAREKAINFYSKNNYTKIDTPFEIETIGTHYMMYKKLL